jgi:hypothetical protein
MGISVLIVIGLHNGVLTDKITRGKPDSKIGFSLMSWKYINVILSQPIKPMPMDSFANNYDVVITLLISGILGALGQGIRVWFGLSELIYNKSSLEHAARRHHEFREHFVGFAAGACFSLLRIFPPRTYLLCYGDDHRARLLSF